MFSARHLALLALPALFTVTACGKPYTVVRQSGPPSALRAAKSMVLQFDYRNLVVNGKPVETWIADKTKEEASYKDDWAKLTGQIEQAVLEGYTAAAGSARLAPYGEEAGPDEAVMIVRMRTFQMGKYIVIAATNTEMTVGVEWWAGGSAVDEITTQAQVRPTITSPSIWNHIRPAGKQLGSAAGRYVNEARSK